jgi:hypothetical protein
VRSNTLSKAPIGSFLLLNFLLFNLAHVQLEKVVQVVVGATKSWVILHSFLNIRENLFFWFIKNLMYLTHIINQIY